MSTRASDLVTLGLRIRHYRGERGLTLDQLGERVGLAGSQLSLIENGRREPKLSILQDVATVLGVPIADLLNGEAPNKRAALEIELARAQKNPLYGALGLPEVKVTKGMPVTALESLIGLHRELARRASEAIATPEEARRANTELRELMREQNNYMPDIEQLAEDRVRASGHVSGALTHREVSVMAEQLGFSLIYVNDLPNSTRSVTDLVNHRIYLPPAVFDQR